MLKRYLFRTAVIISLTIPLFSYAEEQVPLFPCPPKMVVSTDFWKKIYTEVSNGEGLIHDSEHLNILYEVYACPPGGMSYQGRKIKSRVSYYEHQLRRLAANPQSDDPSLRSIASLWAGLNPDAHTYLAASQRVRYQRGQRENFLEGLKRSANYLPEMKKILVQEGVPEDLVYVPHVESSFNCLARSKRGAVGIWQFLSETGKQYMTINKLVDERRDPLLSTTAAAKLLRDNYEKLQSWPLALIAYNYGTNGLLRATKEHNTNDFEYILDNHKKGKFRFASKNFYAEFLAAKEIAQNPDRCFEEMKYAINEPHIEVIYLESASRIKSLFSRYGFLTDDFLKCNHAISLDAVKRNYELKKGFPIYIAKVKYLATGNKPAGNKISIMD
jgi:membrane-bound lytic murein transglycosylase D